VPTLTAAHILPIALVAIVLAYALIGSALLGGDEADDGDGGGD
jgi:hypothetical protein